MRTCTYSINLCKNVVFPFWRMSNSILSLGTRTFWYKNNNANNAKNTTKIISYFPNLTSREFLIESEENQFSFDSAEQHYKTHKTHNDWYFLILWRGCSGTYMPLDQHSFIELNNFQINPTNILELLLLLYSMLSQRLCILINWREKCSCYRGKKQRISSVCYVKWSNIEWIRAKNRQVTCRKRVSERERADELPKRKKANTRSITRQQARCLFFL